MNVDSNIALSQVIRFEEIMTSDKEEYNEAKMYIHKYHL